VDRVLQRAQHLAVERRDVERLEVLGHRAAGDGEVSPCRSPTSSSAFMTTGMPPMRSMSVIT
jgi:hypothetical protein